MKITKVLLDGEPNGLLIKFKQRVTAKLDGSDFIVMQDGESFIPTISIISETTFKLTFTKDDLKLINFKNKITLIYSVMDIQGINVSGIKEFDYYTSVDEGGITEKPDNETGNTEKPDNSLPEIPGFKTVFYDNEIQIEIHTDYGDHFNEFYFEVEVYDFSRYGDFPIEVFYLTDIEKVSEFLLSVNYEFKKDRIYNVKTIFKGASDPAGKVIFERETKKSLYINGMPTLYFTSRYNINSLIEELELSVPIPESDFDFKMLVWKYSQLAYKSAGLHLNDLNTLTDHERTVLGNYVAYKFILTKYSSFLLQAAIAPSSITGGVSAPTGSNIELGDFKTAMSSGGSKMVETQLKGIAGIIHDLEGQIRTISESRAFKKYETSIKQTSTADILYPVKVSQPIDKESNKVWGGYRGFK